jgi:hypothetical protein
VLARVSDWLKVLIKETGIPFLVVGIEGKVDLILQANPQLSRLFAARESLQPFAWDATNLKTARDFSRFVEVVEKAVGLPLPKDVPRVEMLYRLHYATDGVVGNLLNLMRYAALLAQQRGQVQLDLALLARAFQHRLHQHLRTKVNPFESPAAESFTAPPASSPALEKRGKRRLLAISTVLSSQ